MTQRELEIELPLADGHVVDLGVRRVQARKRLVAMVVERVDDGNAEIARHLQAERRVDLDGVVPLPIARDLVESKSARARDRPTPKEATWPSESTPPADRRTASHPWRRA